MKPILINQSILILIDLQKKLMPAIQNSELLIKQCLRLTEIARLLSIPVIGTEQNPKGLGENIPEIKQQCNQTIVKQFFDACQDGLIEALPKNRHQLFIAGCESHVCMMQTALGLIDSGYQVHIIQDAVGSRFSIDKEVALDRLQQAGAKLLTTEMLAFEWIKTSQHPQFADILKAIK
jgi:nicotinamidase-related amidase